MKRDLELNITGKFWQEDKEWMARIESLDLEAREATPYRTLLKTIEAEENQDNSRYSISLIDSGIFYLIIRTTN